VTAATDAATVTDQLLIVTTEESSLYSALFYLFNKFTVARDDTRSAIQYDGPIYCNCKISRHNTALRDDLKTHKQCLVQTGYIA